MKKNKQVIDKRGPRGPYQKATEDEKDRRVAFFNQKGINFRLAGHKPDLKWKPSGKNHNFENYSSASRNLVDIRGSFEREPEIKNAIENKKFNVEKERYGKRNEALKIFKSRGFLEDENPDFAQSEDVSGLTKGGNPR